MKNPGKILRMGLVWGILTLTAISVKAQEVGTAIKAAPLNLADGATNSLPKTKAFKPAHKREQTRPLSLSVDKTSQSPQRAALARPQTIDAIDAEPDTLPDQSPAAALTFQALPDSGEVAPPDTFGAAGPSHLVVACASEIRISDRLGVPISTRSQESFWSGVASNIFDTRVVYDPFGQRFIMTAAGDPGGVNPRLCIAVSSNSNPTGVWYRWTEDVDISNPVYADSPTLGFNKTWIVVQANMYYKSTFGFFRSEVYAYNKANLYANGSGQRTKLVFDPSFGGSQVPATTYDSNQLVVYFVQNWNGRVVDDTGTWGYLRLFSLTGNVGSEKLNTTNSFGEPVFAVASSTWSEVATNDTDILPQLGRTNKIYGGDSSIGNVQYRDGFLYCAQTVFVPATSPTNAVVQWWVLSAVNGDVRHFGRIRDTTGANMFAYPSIAANRYNDVLLGYSRFSPTAYPSAAYSYRIFDDPTDEMRAEALLKAGEAPYYVPVFGLNRWGDWSATAVDPVNDTDIWTIQEYAAQTNAATGGSRWGTWWGRVSPPSDLAVTMTDAPDPIPAGNQITYSILVSNKMEKIFSGVRLVDTLPPGVSFVSATSTRGSCTPTGGTVNCAIGTLSDLEAVNITIIATAGSPGFATNVATVLANGPDLDSSDNTAITSTEIISSADLQVTATDSPDPVHLGNQLTYTLTISNRGPSAAAGVVMTSTLPASVTINNVSGPGQWTINGSVINFTLGVIDFANTAVLTVRCTPTVAGNITNQVRIGANTSDNNSANNSTNLATRVNARPVITQIGTQTINEDVATAIAISISDAETPAANLQLSATSSNQGLIPNQNIVPGGSGGIRTLTITSAQNQFGSNTTTITAVVVDGDGASNTMTFAINVAAVNDPPTISGPPNATVLEDTSTNLTFTIGDIDTPISALTLSANSANQTLVPNSSINFSGSGATRTVSILPATNRFGSAAITIIVSDGSLSSSNTFTLTVTPVNDPPTISSIDPQTILEDTSTTNIVFIVGDPETQPTNLTVTASSSDMNILPNANLALVNLGNSRTIRATPATNQNGLVSITVRVSDGTNSQTTAFDLTILAVNDPPTLAQPANITTNEDAGLISVPLTGISSGAPNENQTLTVRASTSTPDLVTNLQVAYTSPNNSGTLTFTTVADAAGTALINLVVSDGIVADDVTRQLQVTINGINDPPTIDSISNITVLEDSGPRSIALTGISPGPANESAQTVQITATSSAGGIVPDPQINYVPGAATGTLTFTPAPDANGTAIITVTVNDNRPQNNLTTITFQITVTPVNDLPTISGIANQRIAEDTSSAPIAFNFRDPDSGTLTPSASSSDQTLVTDANLAITGSGTNRNLTITPQPNQFGTANITVRVTDTEGGSASTTFTLTVDPINDPPTLAPIPNPAPIDEDATAQTVNLSGITPGPSNESTQTLLITATSSNPLIVPNPTVNYTPPSTTGSLTYTPVANATGSVVITVTVDDRQSSNNTATQTFTVRINPVNDLPTIDGDFDDKFTDEDVPFVLGNIIVGDIETPAGNLTLTGTSSNPDLVDDSGITFSGSGATRTVTVRPLTNEFGSAFITITVSDGNGGTTDVGFQLIVNDVDDAPFIAAPGTQTIAEDTPSGPIPFWLDDVDTPLSSVSITARSSNTNIIADGSITLGGTGTNRNIRFAPSPDASGTTTITLTANDGNSPRTAQFTVNVTAVNDPPTLADIPTPLNILEDAGQQMITLNGVGPGPANESNDVITVTATSNVPGLIPNSTGTNISGVWKLPLTPTANSNGTATITVTVNDGRPTNNTISKSFTVNVQAVNDPPTLNAIGNVTLNEDPPQQSVNLTGISAGPGENQPLTVTATSSHPTLLSLQPVSYTNGSSTAVLRFTVAPTLSGTSTVTVRVSDGSLDATQTFTVTVNPVNDPPTITSISNLTTPEDTPASAQFTIGDEETYAARLTLSATSTNTTLVPNANIVFNGSDALRFVTITPATNQTGNTRITINVSDGTNSVSTSFNLTVNSVNDLPTLNPLPNLALTANPSSPTINLTGITAGGGESQTISITVTSSNPSLVPAPSSVTYTSPNSTGSFILNPDNQALGSSLITVTVKDTGTPAGSFSQSFTVYVRDSANALPTLTGLSNRSTPEDTPISIPFVVNDSATPVSNLIVGASASNPDLIPTNAISITGTTTDRTLTISPPRDVYGSTTIIVWVLDSANGYTSSNFVLQVTATNDAPVISSIPSQTVDRGTNMAPVAFTISDAETPAQNLTLGATSSNQSLLPTANIFFGGSGTNRSIIAYPLASQTGSSTITVTVTDTNSVSTSTTFLLTVRVPQPPALAIRRNGPNVELRWPTDAGLYTVQGRDEINTGSWTDIAATPTVSGTNYLVPQVITGTNKFFRLRN